jgi:hypothetical protein
LGATLLIDRTAEMLTFRRRAVRTYFRATAV